MTRTILRIDVDFIHLLSTYDWFNSLPLGDDYSTRHHALSLETNKFFRISKFRKPLDPDYIKSLEHPKGVNLDTTKPLFIVLEKRLRLNQIVDLYHNCLDFECVEVVEVTRTDRGTYYAQAEAYW